VDGWNYRAETLYGLSKKRGESPAEQGGVSKRRAGHYGRRWQIFLHPQTFRGLAFRRPAELRECDSPEE
jgi:hypothetical protein